MSRQNLLIASTIALLAKDVSSFSSFLGTSVSIPTFMNDSSTISMKVSKGKSKHSKNNTLHTKNQACKRLAGKPGSKLYMDPNKVFIGNLPFKATAEDVKGFLVETLGNLHNVESVKII